MSCAGLVEDVIGHADLADVVERREAREQVDSIGCEEVAEPGFRRQLLREHARVGLRPARVLARLRVPDFGERQQRLHHQALRRHLLLAGLIGALPLAREASDGHRRECRQQSHGRKERRDEDAARRHQLDGTEPDPGETDSDSRRAPRQTEPPHQQGREKPEPDDQLRLEHAGVLGALDEVLLQEIVGDRRLDFDAGKERVERRRDDLARAEGRRPDEDDLVLEHVRLQLPAHARRRPRCRGRCVSDRDSGAGDCSCRRAERSGCRAAGKTRSRWRLAATRCACRRPT